MHKLSPPRRPALPASIGLLAGVAARGSVDVSWLETLPWLLAAGALLYAAVPRRMIPRLFVPLLAATLGARAMEVSCADSAHRTRGWLPVNGSMARLEINGTLTTTPERGAGGERRMTLVGRPSHSAHAPGARLLLRILPSPPEPSQRIDALRAGDAVTAWASLRVPRGGAANPDHARRMLLARGFDAVGTVKSARLVRLQTAGRGPGRLLSAAKAAARQRLDRALGGDGATRQLLGAMLLGDRALVEPECERTLRNAGLVHLLSVSGLHVALAIAAIGWIVRRVTTGPVLRLALSLPAVAALTLFVGAAPPASRAGIAALVALLGRAIGREGDAGNTLALTAGALTLVHPPSLWDPSLLLTFSATAGIVLFAVRIAAALPVWRPVALSLGVSIAAYAASVPICMAAFGNVAPAAVVSNIGGAALCAWVLAAGTGAMVFVGIPWFGAAFAAAARLGTDAMLEWAEVCARMPGASLRTAIPSLAALVLYYGGLALLVFLPRASTGSDECRDRRLRGCTAVLAAILLGAMHLGPLPPGPGEDLVATIFDVGQAQSVAVVGPDGGVLLVDAGGGSGGRFDAGDRIVARRLAEIGVRRVDVLAVTHFHDDHAGGVVSILRDMEVDELWLGPEWHQQPLARRIAQLAVERGTAVVQVEEGHAARRGGLVIEVLHPRRKDRDLGENDRSLAVRAGTLARAVLIPGDLQRRGEERLVARRRHDLRSELLLLPHHGGRGSSTDEFVDAVRPVVAVASAGLRNRFGHPDPEVLRRIAARGIEVRQTAGEGTVRVRFLRNGRTIDSDLRTSRNESESEEE